MGATSYDDSATPPVLPGILSRVEHEPQRASRERGILRWLCPTLAVLAHGGDGVEAHVSWAALSQIQAHVGNRFNCLSGARNPMQTGDGFSRMPAWWWRWPVAPLGGGGPPLAPLLVIRLPEPR